MRLTFKDYIYHRCHRTQNEVRWQAICWVRDQFLMGEMPELSWRSGLSAWNEVYEVSPAYLRPALGRLWKEYMSAYRRQSSRNRRRAGVANLVKGRLTIMARRHG